MPKQKIQIKVNGSLMEADVEPRLLLIHCIRDVFRLTGTHVGCDTSHCGACTVLVDGKAIKSCTFFAVQADGRDVTTVEGLEKDGNLHPVQEGFWQEHGLQCGYCTPGMMISATAFLKENPEADGRRDPCGDFGQSLSLHGLREHRQSNSICRS